MNTDYEVLTVLTDKLSQELIEYNGYGYATGYLESFIRNLAWSINLNKKQIELLKGILNSNINSVKQFNAP
jgi:hypothetical protein